MVEIMKYTIKNLTNSPYTVPGAKGPVNVPARGEAEGDFDTLQIAAIRGVGYFQVTENEPVRVTVKTGPEFDAKVVAATEPVVKRGPGRPKKAD